MHGLAQGHRSVRGGPEIQAQASWLRGHLLLASVLAPASPSVQGEGRFGSRRTVPGGWSEGREALTRLWSLFPTQRDSEHPRCTLVLTIFSKELRTDCLYLCFHKRKV